jgi:hypothetical protein
MSIGMKNEFCHVFKHILFSVMFQKKTQKLIYLMLTTPNYKPKLQ